MGRFEREVKKSLWHFVARHPLAVLVIIAVWFTASVVYAILSR